MAEIQLASSSQVSVWSDDFLKEELRQSGFAPYMGKAKNSIIRINEDLIRQRAKTVNFPMIMAIRGNGVRGAEVLAGKEDDQANFNDAVSVDFVRNALIVPEYTTAYTELALWDAAKEGLREWSADVLKYDIVDALGGIIIPAATAGGVDTWVTYDLATASQRNTHLTKNADRTLAGALKSNSSSLVWATMLGNIDTTNDRMSTAIAETAKRMANTTGKVNATYPNNPAMSPYKTMDGVYTGYVCFCAPNSFRDIKADSAMVSANRDARAREGGAYKNNPIFMDGDLLKDGIIYRECDELQRLTLIGAGNGGCDVDRNFLCGQAALGIGWGMRPEPRTRKDDDYGMRPGTGIVELRGQKKISYQGTQWGVVEILTASVSDA